MSEIWSRPAGSVAHEYACADRTEIETAASQSSPRVSSDQDRRQGQQDCSPHSDDLASAARAVVHGVQGPTRRALAARQRHGLRDRVRKDVLGRRELLVGAHHNGLCTGCTQQGVRASALKADDPRDKRNLQRNCNRVEHESGSNLQQPGSRRRAAAAEVGAVGLQRIERQHLERPARCAVKSDTRRKPVSEDVNSSRKQDCTDGGDERQRHGRESRPAQRDERSTFRPDPTTRERDTVIPSVKAKRWDSRASAGAGVIENGLWACNTNSNRKMSNRYGYCCL